MSAATDHEVFKTVRSERRWAIFDRACVAFVAFACAVIVIGLISAATLVTMDAWSAPDHGVMDGDQ